MYSPYCLLTLNGCVSGLRVYYAILYHGFGILFLLTRMFAVKQCAVLCLIHLVFTAPLDCIIFSCVRFNLVLFYTITGCTDL